MQTVAAVIDILRQNESVSQLIGNRIYPFDTADISQDCIVYVATPLEDDKVKESWRVELTILSKQLANAYAIDAACRSA